MRKKISEISGFENFEGYEVDSDGNVYSYIKHIRDKKKGIYIGRSIHMDNEQEIKGSIDSKGYKYIDIRNKVVERKCPKLHRLVALAFLPNPYNKPQVNHIDGNKLNNRIDNLEYVTNKENRQHALESGLKKEIGYNVAQYDLNGNLLNVFVTAREALEHLGKPPNSGNIGRAINGNRKTAYGYVWEQYEGSTTISKESTLQANGNGNGEHPEKG